MKSETKRGLKMAASFGVAWAVAVTSLTAQSPDFGTFEIGAFAQYTDFQRNAGCVCNWPEDGFGAGGRIGAFYNSMLSFELDVARTVADRVLVDGTLRYVSFAGRVMANHFLDDLTGPSIFMGAGPMLGRYEDIPSRYGASGIAGFRYGVSEHLALRVDGVIDYMPSEENLNLAGRVGGSFMLGYPSRPIVPIPPPPPAPVAPAAATTGAPESVAETTPVPLSAPATTTDLSAITAPVYFDYDRSNLRPDGRSVLEIKLPWLRANPELRLRLEGNADDRGTTAYNIPLGMLRAIEARDFLVTNGIASDRLEIISYGDTRPRCTDEAASDDCHQTNRRVDFDVISGATGGVRVPD